MITINEAFIEAIKNNDSDAWSKLTDIFRGKLRKKIGSREHEHIEDYVQDCLVRAMKYFRRFNTSVACGPIAATVHSYCNKIVNSLIVDRARKRERQPRIIEATSRSLIDHLGIFSDIPDHVQKEKNDVAMGGGNDGHHALELVLEWEEVNQTIGSLMKNGKVTTTAVQAFRLSLKGYSIREIAQNLGVPETQVNNHIYRVKKKIGEKHKASSG